MKLYWSVSYSVMALKFTFMAVTIIVHLLHYYIRFVIGLLFAYLEQLKSHFRPRCNAADWIYYWFNSLQVFVIYLSYDSFIFGLFDYYSYLFLQYILGDIFFWQTGNQLIHVIYHQSIDFCYVLIYDIVKSFEQRFILSFCYSWNVSFSNFENFLMQVT